MASRKLDPAELLAIGFAFANAAKGISSCEVARTFDLSQRNAWLLGHKLRAGLVEAASGVTLGGVVEIDGAVFGGHRRHENIVRDGRQYRYSKKMTANKRVVIVAKERGGRTRCFVGRKESDALRQLARCIQPGSIIHADLARAWNSLERLYDMLRINHSRAYSFADACTNNAESYFAQLRKLHTGTHHKISGDTFASYATEVAWRRDMSDLTPWQRTAALFRAALTAREARVLARDRLTQDERNARAFEETITPIATPRYGKRTAEIIPFTVAA